jgi:glycosyltransferase involved in cell wall biosynthesis
VTLPANVELIGYMPPHELRSMYAQAKFVIVPLRRTTQYGAGCTAVLEAMAMGRAVIASRHPGMPDYVRDGETGILVDPGDVQELRQAMRYLLDHPEEADRMGTRGRQAVEEEFNLDIWLRKMVAVVQEVLGESICEEKSLSESCS